MAQTLLEPYAGKHERVMAVYARKMHEYLCQQAAGRRILATTTWRWQTLDGRLKTDVRTMDITDRQKFYEWFTVYHGGELHGVTIFEAQS